jgi:hypothetical protein
VAIVAVIIFVGLKIFGTKTSPDTGRRNSLKYVVLAILGGLAVLLAGFLIYTWARHHSKVNWSYSYSTSANRAFVRSVPMRPVQPLQPAVPQLPAVPQPPDQSDDSAVAAYNQLVDRLRGELGRSVRFKQLHLSSTNDSNLVVTFSKLQEMRLVNGTNAWRDISGSLVGTQTDQDRWVFEGQDTLSVMRFDMLGMELKQVLAGALGSTNSSATSAAPAAEYSHANMIERLGIAENIMGISEKDQVLGGLAREAAAAEDIEMAQSALGAMSGLDDQGHATHDVAIMLAKTGHRKEAIAMAEGISSISIHDETLTELAQ